MTLCDFCDNEVEIPPAPERPRCADCWAKTHDPETGERKRSGTTSHTTTQEVIVSDSDGSTFIPEEDCDPNCVKRNQRLAKVRPGRLVGNRGGIRDPIAIVWRQSGTGLFRLVERGTGKTVVYPWVRYENGKGTICHARAEDWHAWVTGLVGLS